MAGAPWEKYRTPSTPSIPREILGPPDLYKSRDQELQEEAAARARQTQPLEVESKSINIQQGQQALGNTVFTQKDKLRSDYQALPETKTFKEFLPALFKAVEAPDNAQGDLAVLYAFSKSMDPTTGVREGEQAMARNTASTAEQVQVWLDKVQKGERLPPTVRLQFIETMRETGKQYARSYGQTRKFYNDLAKRNGFDPNEIIGPDAYEPFKEVESEYVRRHGGTPKIEGVPIDPINARSSAPTEAGFGVQEDPRMGGLSEPQKAAYEAWWGANPDPSPDQLRQFLGTIGVKGKILNAEDIIKAKKRGGGISSDIELRPDISDVRGQGGVGEAIDAGIRGAADTASFGLADKVAAVGDTIFDGGTYSENVARQYAISDYDAANHPYARIGGQVAGGFAVPLGKISSLPQLAGKGAAAGAAYGVGSSRTLADIPQNAFMGGAAGAIIPTALVGGARGVGAVRGALGRGAQEVPPLVDPVTGELNTPMDAMTPAQRIQMMESQGISTITPGMAGGRSARVVEQGFNNLPGSAGLMEDVYAPASKELRGAMQGVAQQAGTSRTLNEAGSELQRGAREWMTRFDEVTSKAYEAIPISPKAPTRLGNTASVLDDLAAKVESNPELAEEIKDPTLARYLDAIYKGGLDWQGLKQFRTFIGNKVGQFRFSEDARTGDYRALYGALSEDMRASAAAQGPKALRAFERANNIKAQGERRIEDGLVRILGPDAKGSPEKAAAAVRSMTMGGKATGDVRALAQVKASTVKSGAWDEIASTLIHLGGQPANSEGRAFNPQTFVQWYADMSEPARRMLFKPELRKSLEGFVATSQQVGRLKGMTNTSNTTPTMIGSGVMGASGILAVTNPMALFAVAGGAAANFGMAKAWTNPNFVRRMTGFTRAAASGNPNAVQSEVGRLTKLATTNPELRGVIEELLAKLANDNAPQAGRLAASPDEGAQNAAQPQ